MIVVATDAPLDSRQLGRLAKRAVLGMARAGSSGSNGSSDYAIAFSTTSRSSPQRFTAGTPSLSRLSEEELSPLFEAAIEATEEASTIPFCGRPRSTVVTDTWCQRFPSTGCGK